MQFLWRVVRLLCKTCDKWFLCENSCWYLYELPVKKHLGILKTWDIFLLNFDRVSWADRLPCPEGMPIIVTHGLWERLNGWTAVKLRDKWCALISFHSLPLCRLAVRRMSGSCISSPLVMRCRPSCCSFRHSECSPNHPNPFAKALSSALHFFFPLDYHPAVVFCMTSEDGSALNCLFLCKSSLLHKHSFWSFLSSLKNGGRQKGCFGIREGELFLTFGVLWFVVLGWPWVWSGCSLGAPWLRITARVYAQTILAAEK